MIELLNHIDKKIFYFFNTSISNSIFDIFMPIVTNQDIWTIPILILIFYLAYKGGRIGKSCILLLIIAVGLSDYISASILKPYFERLRPSHANLDEIIILMGKGGKYGFVSSHAANIFAACTVLGFFYKKYKIQFLFIAYLISFSRVYVGVHYPGDVLFGGILGYLLATIIVTIYSILIFNYFKKEIKTN
ncbi:MAG: phosphatase PAP2 family protein [Candidatus Marinimicrobia bacterium]|nr:phosphatase PAP2 family protein [Candidatus Neomarinimicrobiota bacterium]